MEANLQASLDSNLKNLKLPTILKEYSEVAHASLELKHTYEQFLLSVAKREVDQRFNKKIKYLLHRAKFPNVKTIDDYDFKQIDIAKEAIIQLCHGNFLSDFTNVVFFGTPGSGKTHLAMAIGRELCLKGKKVLFHTGCSLIQELVKAKNSLTLTNFFKKMMGYDLVIIDELGYIPFDKTEGDLLFQFISNRYERKSVMITTNLAFSEWDILFKDKMLASAAIDRIVHHSQVFKFEKKTSYRAEAAKKKLIMNK